MERIIKSTQVPGGVLNDLQKAKVRQINLNPNFDKKSKSWQLKKILKSQTKVIAWLIMVDGEYYLATASFVPRQGERVTIYRCDSRGKLDISQEEAVYPSYVDLEAGVDRFVAELQAKKLSNSK